MKTATKLLIGSITRTGLVIINMAIAFFMMPFLVKNLGDKWYGIWTVIGSLVGYYYLVDFGLASAVQRYVAKYIGQKNSEMANVTVNTALIIFLLLGFFLFILTIIISLSVQYFVQNPEDVSIISAIILLLGINLALEFPVKAFAGIIGAYIRYDLLSYSRLFVLLLTTGLIVYFISAGYGILALAVISFIGTQLSNILFYLIARYVFKEMKINLNYYKKDHFRKLFSYSLWSFVIKISEQLRFRIDSLVIAGFLSPVYVTHYFIGARLADYFREILMMATDILTPVFTQYHANKQYEELKEKLLFVTKIITILSIFSGGIIILVGKPFIIRWMGEEYVDAYPILLVLIIALTIDLVLNPLKSTLLAIAEHKHFAKPNIIEGVLNLIFSVILIKYYNILGVALGTLIPIVLVKVAFIPYRTCKLIDLSLIKYILNLVPSIVLTLSYLVVHQIIFKEFLLTSSYINILIVAISAIPFYLIIVYFLLFKKTEQLFIRNLLLMKIKSG